MLLTILKINNHYSRVQYQHPVQGVPAVPCHGVQLNTHLHVVDRLRITGVKPPFLIYSVTHSVPAYNDQSANSVRAITQKIVWLIINV